MRFALLTAGTRGDTQPYVALASELIRRGHEAVITVTEDLAGFVQKAGVRAIPYAGLSMRATFDSPQGKEFLAKGQMMRFLRWMGDEQSRHEDAVLEALRQASEWAEVLVSHPIAEVGTRGLAHWKRLPLLRTQLAPTIPTRAFPSPLLDLGRMPFGALNWGSHRLVQAFAWRSQRGAHESACRKLGIAPASRNLHLLLEEERVPCAHMVSPTLLPRPSDWAPHHVQTGHCGLPPSLRQGIGEGPLEPALERWLQGGSAPIYFGFGSLPVLDPPAFLRTVRETLVALGMRGLIVSGWTRMPEFEGDERLFLASSLNHDEVLPRCQAVVHHGGLGTTTATLAAGVPAVVCSVFLDQIFWGRRIRELGAGEWLRFQQFTPAKLRAALERALSDSAKARAAELGARMREEHGLRNTADFMEQHAQALMRTHQA